MRKREQGLFGVLGLGFYWSLWYGEPAEWAFGQELYPGELRLWGVLFRFLVLLLANRVVVGTGTQVNLVWIGMYLALTLYQPKLELVTSAVVLALLCLGGSGSDKPVVEPKGLSPRALSTVEPRVPPPRTSVSSGNTQRRRSKSPQRRPEPSLPQRKQEPSPPATQTGVVAAAKKKAMEEQEHRLQEKVQRLRL